MSVQLAQVQQVDLLYNKIMAELKSMHETAKPKQRGTFAEPEESQHDGFGMPSMGGLFTVQRGNLLVMGLGAALAGVVGGFITRFLPTNLGLAGLPQIIAGIIGKKFIGKSGAIADFFTGVLIAGVGLLLGGFVGGIGGGSTGGTGGTIFGERKTAFREPGFGQTPTVQVRTTGMGNDGFSRRTVF